MKKGIVLSMIGSLLLSIVACGPNGKTEKEVKNLRSYVDSVEQNRHQYYQDETYWNTVEEHYASKQQEIDAQTKDLSIQAKADYEKIKADYAVLKEKNISEKLRENNRLALRNSLYNQEKIDNEARFLFMVPSNALNIYESFVTKVNHHKDEYSREDWDEIKVLYNAMNVRKNEIENQIGSRDNQKILNQKVKFLAIKALNRPMSEKESQ